MEIILDNKNFFSQAEESGREKAEKGMDVDSKREDQRQKNFEAAQSADAKPSLFRDWTSTDTSDRQTRKKMKPKMSESFPHELASGNSVRTGWNSAQKEEKKEKELNFPRLRLAVPVN